VANGGLWKALARGFELRSPPSKEFQHLPPPSPPTFLVSTISSHFSLHAK
jgi:hypothetical protein